MGLGASGYIGNLRYKNTVNLDRYLKGEYIQDKEEVTNKDIFTYQVMLNLRTKEGISLSLLKNKEKEIASLIKDGYLEKQGDRLCPTYEGMMILDTIILQLI